MRFPVYMLAILAGVLVSTMTTSAGLIDLNYVSLATAVDQPPQDGDVDSFTLTNVGSVNNNGYTSFRTAFEFSLGSIPIGSPVRCARLNLALNNWEGTRRIEVRGFAGDGAVQLQDFGDDALIISASVSPVGYQTLTFDVTAVVTDLVLKNRRFAGFNIREEPANTANYGVMRLELVGSPVLSINIGSAGAEQEQGDLDGDCVGDAFDICPNVFNLAQEDGNGDGSGDACQPTLTVQGVTRTGSGDLALRLSALDPQNDPLGGSIAINATQAREVVLLDISMNFDCSQGFLPEDIPGEGLGFLSGSYGVMLLFDLDSVLICADGQQDYEIAGGPCTNTVTAFAPLLDLASIVPTPMSLCVRKAGGVYSFDAMILDLEPESLHLSLTIHERVFELSFQAGLPTEFTLPQLQSGATYDLLVTVTDGNTRPVTVQTSFVYQGERTMVVRNGIPPQAVIAAPAQVECDQPGGAYVLLDGSGSTDPDPGETIASYEWFIDFGQATQQFLGAGVRLAVVLPIGSNRVTLRVTGSDDQLSGTADTVIAVADTIRPTLTCPTVGEIECSAPGGSAVSVSATALDLCSPTVTVTNSRTGAGADASGSYPLGTTGVTFSATDASGNMATCTSSIEVRDTTPPVPTLTLSPMTLWPPNHRMVNIGTDIAAIDVCSIPTIVLASVASSEPEDALGVGDGNTTADVQGADPGTADSSFQVRAERDGDGPGRTYAVTYRAVDGSGNATQARAFVVVPHDLGGSTEPLDLSVQGDLSGTFLSWDPVPGATAYDAIRGNVSSLQQAENSINLGTVTCLQAGSTQTRISGLEDGETPALGEAFFYLVAYHDEWGSSGYGTVGVAKPRVVTSGDCH